MNPIQVSAKANVVMSSKSGESEAKYAFDRVSTGDFGQCLSTSREELSGWILVDMGQAEILKMARVWIKPMSDLPLYSASVWVANEPPKVWRSKSGAKRLELEMEKFKKCGQTKLIDGYEPTFDIKCPKVSSTFIHNSQNHFSLN